MKALVIGGTGPTGHFIVNALIRRGYDVAMLHTGRHEVAEIPPSVEHIHTDPFSEVALRDALGNRTFDLTIAAYGRLRRIAEIMKGRTGRFLSVGGAPAYRGYMNPGVLHPQGLPIPTPEDAPRLTIEDAAYDAPFAWRNLIRTVEMRIAKMGRARMMLEDRLLALHYPPALGVFLLDGQPRRIFGGRNREALWM